MENNNANKAKFFSMYYGQKVMLSIYNSENPIDVAWAIRAITLDQWPQVETSYLSLRSISSLTDEELTECCKLMDFSDWDNPIYLNERRHTIINAANIGALWTCCADYLRSIGILIPWMDLSVEEIKAYGWAKES